jgi:hypothetical protein
VMINILTMVAVYIGYRVENRRYGTTIDYIPHHGNFGSCEKEESFK